MVGCGLPSGGNTVNVWAMKKLILGLMVSTATFVAMWLFVGGKGGGANDSGSGAGAEAERDGIGGLFDRAVDSAKEAVRREADEAIAAMEDAARRKADAMKQQAAERAEALKEEAKAAIKEELTAKLEESVATSADDGLKKLAASIQDRVKELTESFRDSDLSQWESEELSGMLQDLLSGDDDKALEKLNQLNQPDLAPERSEKYDALIDDVAAFAAKREE
jgi:hypothetical protein